MAARLCALARSQFVLCCALAVLLVGRAAAGAEPEPRYRLEFAAGRVDIYGKMQRLELSRHVVIRVDRYRLTSNHLVLQRGPRGIQVDGNGRLAFCPCARPPVSIGFHSVLVAPPTDLLIAQPTLRVGDVPVLWLPYLWLRAPTRLGLLPPRVEWRGEDGLLLGSGVHIPLGSSADRAESAVDLRAAGYVKGGAQIDARVVTPQTSTRVVWDRLHQSSLAVDAHGSDSGRSGATAAWRIDALRGARGRRGTLSLEEAARLYDRGELSLVRASAESVLAAGMRADALRGGALDSFGAIGPRFYAGGGGALGQLGEAEAWVDLRTVSDQSRGAASLGVGETRIALDGRPGPFDLGSELIERLDLGIAETDAGMTSVSEARVRAGLPLVRAYGPAQDPLLHWVEPFTELRQGYVVERNPTLRTPLAPASGELVSAALGLRTAIGRSQDREAVSLDLRGGASGSARAPEAATEARLRGRLRGFAVSSAAAWLPHQLRALATASRIRIGRRNHLHLTSYVEGRWGMAPTLARWLSSDALDASGSWFDRAGWTLGGALGVPWTQWLASTVSADYDASAHELLGVRGALGYRHPCGCLAALAWVGHRMGRRGVDAWLVLDLVP